VASARRAFKRVRATVRHNALITGACDLSFTLLAQLKDAADGLVRVLEEEDCSLVGGKRGVVAFASREIVWTLHSFGGGGYVFGGILKHALGIMEGAGGARSAIVEAVASLESPGGAGRERAPGSVRERNPGSVFRGMPTSSRKALEVIVLDDSTSRWLKRSLRGREGTVEVCTAAWVHLGNEADAFAELVAAYADPVASAARNRDARAALRDGLSEAAESFCSARSAAASAAQVLDAADSPAFYMVLKLLMMDQWMLDRLALVLVPQLMYAPSAAWKDSAFVARFAQAATGLVSGATGGKPPGKGIRRLNDNERKLYAAALLALADDVGRGRFVERGLPVFAGPAAAAAAAAASAEAVIDRGPHVDDDSYRKDDVAAATTMLRKVLDKKWCKTELPDCFTARHVPATEAEATALFTSVFEPHADTLRRALTDAAATFTAARGGGGGGGGGGGRGGEDAEGGVRDGGGGARAGKGASAAAAPQAPLKSGTNLWATTRALTDPDVANFGEHLLEVLVDMKMVTLADKNTFGSARGVEFATLRANLLAACITAEGPEVGPAVRAKLFALATTAEPNVIRELLERGILR